MFIHARVQAHAMIIACRQNGEVANVCEGLAHIKEHLSSAFRLLSVDPPEKQYFIGNQAQ